MFGELTFYVSKNPFHFICWVSRVKMMRKVACFLRGVVSIDTKYRQKTARLPSNQAPERSNENKWVLSSAIRDMYDIMMHDYGTHAQQ